MSGSGDLNTHVIRVAFLVPANVRPKDLSRALDGAFADYEEVLQFVVEGQGVDDISEASDAMLMDALVSGAVEELGEGG